MPSRDVVRTRTPFPLEFTTGDPKKPRVAYVLRSLSEGQTIQLDAWLGKIFLQPMLEAVRDMDSRDALPARAEALVQAAEITYGTGQGKRLLVSARGFAQLLFMAAQYEIEAGVANMEQIGEAPTYDECLKIAFRNDNSELIGNELYVPLMQLGTDPEPEDDDGNKDGDDNDQGEDEARDESGN